MTNKLQKLDQTDDQDWCKHNSWPLLLVWPLNVYHQITGCFCRHTGTVNWDIC